MKDLFSAAATAFLILSGLSSTFCLLKTFGRGVEEDDTSETEGDNNAMVSVLPTGNPEEDQTLIEDIHIQEAMMQVQELSKEERRRRNENLILSLRTLKANLRGAYIWMKSNLHPSTCKTILEDHDHKASCLEKRLSRRAKTTKKEKVNSFRSKITTCFTMLKITCLSLIKRAKAIFSVYFDLLKDAVILAPILNIIGWNFFFDFSSFPSFLAWALVASILLPLALSALGIMLGDPTILLGCGAWSSYRTNQPSCIKRFLMMSFIFLFFFTIPAMLVNAREKAKAKRKRLLHSGKIQLLQSEENTLARDHLKKMREVNDYLEETRKTIISFKKNELSTETVLPITIQTFMILLGPANTRHSATHTGLQKIYEKDHTGIVEFLDRIFKVGESRIAMWLLIASIVKSFQKIAKTYVKIKTEEKKDFFPKLPKRFLNVRSLLVSARISCIVAFFAPYLGLLDILSHWKADQLMDNPPEFIAYTVVSLGTGFGVFIGLLLVQTVAIFITKWKISNEFRKAKVTSILEHLALTVNLPDNYADWDQCEGDVEEHREMKSSVIKENVVMICIHAVSNMLMLVPIWVTSELNETYLK